MKSKFRIAVVAAVAAIGLTATAGAASFDHCADQLKDLGLFQGTAQGYELDRAPTRAEAATMLVRLLGKEEEAKTLDYTAPFTDLAGWEKPYVQYLYDNGLTTGATATTFEPEQGCSAQMYTTFLLRALGYSDTAGGDFTYAQAISFGESLGLVDYANCNQDNFLRDHVAAMSLTALDTPVKGDENAVLLQKLVDDGAVDANKASGLLTFFDRYASYTDASYKMNDAAKMDMTANIAADVSMGDTKIMDLTMPLNMKVDANPENMDQSKIAMTGTVKINMNESMVEQGAPATINQDIAYYYTDGVYYVNMGDQKFKMNMSVEDVMAQMGNLTGMQSSEPLCLIEAIDQSGSDMTVTYSSSGMNALVNSVLANMGMDMSTMDAQINFEDISSKVTISNGDIKNMNLAMKMSMTAEGQSMALSMTMDCAVNGLGDSVQIALPSDLDTYVDIIGGTTALIGGVDEPAA
ncbi:S-layer homology domain-containing protein [Candidatus Agathobaculum pullicola]|uniref:S-layer homology domain-containing protein n=1 Tax=Candidatus Agathobaculum pullicola TaxID=2838426 RepID=UPI003F8DD7B6